MTYDWSPMPGRPETPFFLGIVPLPWIPSGGQSGIQMLLTAEQEAQQILSSARSMKMARLKQAKDEANQEAAAYRASLEQEHQKKVSEGSGNSNWNVKRLEEETNQKIQELNDAACDVSSEVVAMLMEQITTIKT